MAKETAKDQGFPDAYLNENGGFKIGMDARAKSDLVLSALGLITADEPGNSLHVFTKTEAEKLLAARDWTGFLDRKRALVDEQAAKKAAAAEQREATARERAEAKAVKDQEKAAAKAAKDAEKAAAASTASEETPPGAAGDLSGVKPDQKSQSPRSSGRSRAKAGAGK